MGNGMQRIKKIIYDWWLLLAIIGFWLAVTRGSDVWYNPVQIVASLPVLFQEYNLSYNILLSIARVLSGFAIALIIALPFGLAIGISRRFAEWVEPIIEIFRYMAPIAWIPLAIFWFKGGNASAVFIVAYGSFFPLVVSIINGIRNINKSYVEAGRTMGASRKDLIFQVYLPVTLHETLLGSRIAFATAWTVIVAAELALATKAGAVGENGLGQLMFILYSNGANTSLIAGTMLTIGILALLFDMLTQRLKKAYIKW